MNTTISAVICGRCGFNGHYSWTCRDDLARKLARIEAGLAPEDVTALQAANTGRLRGDPDYLPTWIRHELAMDKRIIVLDEV